MPNVVGLTQAAARAITGAGLTVGTVTTASSTTVPAGSVISQSPSAGTQVTPAAPSRSSSRPVRRRSRCPNVVGLTQAAATTAITGAGLTVGTVTTASSTTVPAGSVISQTPSPARRSRRQRRASRRVVRSAAGRGAERRRPDAGRGDDRDHGREPDGRHGHDRVEHHGARRIGDQSVARPRARRSAIGSAVALVVSSGLPQVAVPNVVGLTQAAATTAITGAGLTVGTVTTARARRCPPDR